jgi:fibronectin-binding autotransporter adhesin
LLFSPRSYPCLIALSLAFCASAWGGTFTWTPIEFPVWNDSNNWTPTGTPGSGDTVNYSAAVANSYIWSNMALAGFQYSGTATTLNVGGSNNLGSLTVSGAFNATAGSPLTVSVQGDFNNNTGSTLTLNGTGAMTNGILTVDSLSKVTLGTSASQTFNQTTINGNLILKTNSQFSTDLMAITGGGLEVDSGAVLSVGQGQPGGGGLNQFLALSGGAVDLAGGTMHIGGNAPLGAAFSGDVTHTGSRMSGGFNLGGLGILNLSNDLALNGPATIGSAANAIEALTGNITINNTATNPGSNPITLMGGGKIQAFTGQVILSGNMNIDNVTLYGVSASNAVVLQGNNSLAYSTLYNFVDLAPGSVTTLVSNNNTANGQIYLQGNAKLVLDSTVQGGFYYLSPTAVIDSTNGALQGATVTLQGDLNITNSLTVDDCSPTCGGSDYSIAGAASNSGTLSIDGASALSAVGTYSQSTGTTEVNGSLQAGGLTISGGLLKGDGTITGDVTVGSAILKPGDSPGTLTVNGNVILSSNTATEVQIQDLLDFDILVAKGSVTLNGSLDIELLGGYVPVVGNKFDFLTYTGSLSGTFSSLNTFINSSEHWGVNYNSGVVELQVLNTVASSTPEPSTWMLMLGSVFALGLYRRKTR